jgi:uncharacterized MAPEG superfamily protein
MQPDAFAKGVNVTMNPSVSALGLFIAWALLLLVLMEAGRSFIVIRREKQSNEFKPDNANLSPFMQRLARAHANCLEGFPIFGGLLLLAIVTGRHDLTDPLAYWLVAARIAQSTVHLISLSVIAVNTRFSFFLVQIVIALYWVWALIFV